MVVWQQEGARDEEKSEHKITSRVRRLNSDATIPPLLSQALAADAVDPALCRQSVSATSPQPQEKHKD